MNFFYLKCMVLGFIVITLVTLTTRATIFDVVFHFIS